MEEQTVMEYAVANRLSVSGVQKALTNGRLTARKSGKRWLIPAGAIIAPMGEKATAINDSTEVDVDVIATTQPTELTGLAKEMDDLELEEKVIDARQRVAEKRLQVQAGLDWGTFQKKQLALAEKEELVMDAQAKVKQDEDALDDDRLLLEGVKTGMEDWLSNARGKVKALSGVLVALKKGSYEQQVPVGGNSYKTMTRYFDYTPKQINDLLNKISESLLEIVELPLPDLTIPAGKYTEDEFDEQEPEDDVDSEQVLEAVEKIVDETVEKVEGDEPDIIKKPRKKQVRK